MDEKLLSRFTGAIKGLVPNVSNDTKFGLAVSGGPDSLALLLLGQAAFPNQVMAATVDHKLRQEAADEARYVAKICGGYSVTHEILTPERAITGNIQSSARKARYALLNNWAERNNIEWVVTAHHSDDQLETILMRVARGGGVDGLSGIRARNGNIIRPLLQFSKSELVQICTDANVSPVHDPSNEDDNFDRVKMRQFLARTPHPFDAILATRTAAALTQASAALDWTVQILIRERVAQHGRNIEINAQDLPPELQRRLLIYAVKKMDDGRTMRGDTIERTLESLIDGKTSTIGNILCVGGDIWRLSPAPSRRNG